MAKTTITVGNLQNEHIKRVYSGKPGCMCGCLGKYSETKSMKTRVLNKLRGVPQQELDVDDVCGKDVSMYVHVEIDGRVYCAYLNADILVTGG